MIPQIMNPLLSPPPPPSDEIYEYYRIVLKWTPRVIVSGFSGYYCLGYAYEAGIMASIDRLAIKILRPSMGYIGIAAFMPTFQWYSAWGVRVAAAVTAGIAYDVSVRIIFYAYRCIAPRFAPAERVIITHLTHQDGH